MTALAKGRLIVDTQHDRRADICADAEFWLIRLNIKKNIKSVGHLAIAEL